MKHDASSDPFPAATASSATPSGNFSGPNAPGQMSPEEVAAMREEFRQAEEWAAAEFRRRREAREAAAPKAAE